MEDLQDISKITIQPKEETERWGIYIVGPLVKGYGHTLGNSLRRVLLTSLTGAAITQAKIEGVRHQFSTISQVVEDVVQIVLNLKQIRLKLEGKSEANLHLSVQRAGEVTAGDFETAAGVTVINPEFHIATLVGKNPKLKMDVKVETGRGYRLGDEASFAEVGLIAVDALFTPIERVNYQVEPIRVGRYTDYEQLILEVATDGTTTPAQAVKDAGKILADYFSIFYTPRPKVEELAGEKKAPEAGQIKLTRLPIEELELPTRVTNSLHRGGVETVGDLIAKTPPEISAMPNLGEKSIEMIKEILANRGLQFKES